MIEEGIIPKKNLPDARLFSSLFLASPFRFFIVSGFPYLFLIKLYLNHYSASTKNHGLRTPREEIAFTERPKIQSQSQSFRYGQSIFCLPHQPNFSGIFDLCLHWVSIVRASRNSNGPIPHTVQG